MSSDPSTINNKLRRNPIDKTGELLWYVVYLGWPIAHSYMSPNAGGEGVAGSQLMSTAVHRSPNKFWRTNCVFNLWTEPLRFLSFVENENFPVQVAKMRSNLVANSTLFGYLIHRYRYNTEIDEEKVDTYNISVGVCLWFCRLDVFLKLGCSGAVLMWMY